MFQTFVVAMRSENVLGLLLRLSSLMSRNSLKIQEMQVLECIGSRLSEITLIVHTDARKMEHLVKQLAKWIDLHEVHLKQE